MRRYLGLLVCLPFVAAGTTPHPSSETRGRIFDAFVSEIDRLDGEGLLARKGRPEGWAQTTANLRKQALQADTPAQFGEVFKWLDRTYPNLHAHLVLSEAFDSARANSSRPAVRFAPEIVRPQQKVFRYKINSIETEAVKDIAESVRPAIGDDLLEINDRPVGEWARENFIYCKFPLREQCEMNMFDQFRRGHLSWRPGSPLRYTLLRNGRQWKVAVPLAKPSGRSPDESDHCQAIAGRYEGFAVAFRGLNVCVFESAKHPGVSVLRIHSFAYRGLPETDKIQSLEDEVNAFFAGYWQERAPRVTKLVIDLIDNGGGDTPTAWYEVFYPRPFQEMYVQFKKTPELDDPAIRREMFYEDAAKEIWFAQLVKSGRYGKIPVGGFLPPVPQFCASEEKSCAEGLFKPRPHGFRGQVRILTNEWCISSCTGFIWSMRDQLGARVKTVGLPDSGDSAYARLYLDLYLDSALPGGFRTAVSPRAGRTRQDLPAGAVLRQQVAVTRSTDSRGRVISARPNKIDVWIPFEYRHYDKSWESKAFEAALDQ